MASRPERSTVSARAPEPPRLRLRPGLPAPGLVGSEGGRDTDTSLDHSERASVVARCLAALTSTGITAALSVLNERTRFRFTGVYETDPPVLRTVALFDRENPALQLAGGVVPIEGAHFVHGDSIIPAPSGSYAAAPIRMSGGVRWGTLCHFDLRPRLLSPAECAILRAVAAMLARSLADDDVANASLAAAPGGHGTKDAQPFRT